MNRVSLYLSFFSVSKLIFLSNEDEQWMKLVKDNDRDILETF